MTLTPCLCSDGQAVKLPGIREVFLQGEEANQPAFLHDGKRRHGRGVPRIHKKRWLDAKPVRERAKNDLTFALAVDTWSDDVHGV